MSFAWKFRLPNRTLTVAMCNINHVNAQLNVIYKRCATFGMILIIYIYINGIMIDGLIWSVNSWFIAGSQEEKDFNGTGRDRSVFWFSERMWIYFQWSRCITLQFWYGHLCIWLKGMHAIRDDYFSIEIANARMQWTLGGVAKSGCLGGKWQIFDISLGTFLKRTLIFIIVLQRPMIFSFGKRCLFVVGGHLMVNHLPSFNPII